MPSSACPKCGHLIRPYDNIPVLSYLILGGKCRGCKTKISPMYPLVEFLTGVLFCLLLRFWDFARYPEVGDLFSDHDRVGVHRSARTDFAGPGEFHRIRFGFVAQPVHETDRWHGVVALQSHFPVSS